MFSTKEMPSPSSLFSAYASMAATAMLLRSMANDLIPAPLRGFLLSAVHRLFKSHLLPDQTLTLVVEDSAGMSPNELFDAASDYLATRIRPDADRLKISRAPREKALRIGFEKGETFRDSHGGVDDLRWRFACSDPPQNPQRARPPARSFELSFHRRHRQMVLDSYIPSVVEAAKRIREGERALQMHTLSGQGGRSFVGGGGGGARWESVSLEHPATFETLAMEEGAKAAVVEDLDRFVRRKEFYRRVGRAWKRGYLLYGPPGSGKSSLVAAVANYLKFDVYDLQLASISRDSDLRRLLLATANRSILVIEDIDCSVGLPDRIRSDQPHRHQQQQQDSIARTTLTLSGLLNFIDGLWSSCGDERIIIFTTNHKDRLDPALLRPGRMDMHIHMSYCTFHAFKLLASNYLGIRGSHELFPEIEALIAGAEVAPAQVAEELMRSEDSYIALRGLVSLLKRKRSNLIDVVGDENGARKRLKTAKKQVVSRSRSSTRKVIL